MTREQILKAPGFTPEQLNTINEGIIHELYGRVDKLTEELETVENERDALQDELYAISRELDAKNREVLMLRDFIMVMWGEK